MAIQPLFGVPKFITARFHSVNTYVWELLFPDDRLQKILDRYQTKGEKREQLRQMKQIAQEASLAYFICDIKTFLNAGSAAAKNAVDVLHDLDIDGFYIGRKQFRARNENVLMGDELSKRLIELISDDYLRGMVSNSPSTSRIIDYYKNVVSSVYGH